MLFDTFILKLNMRN